MSIFNLSLNARRAIFSSSMLAKSLTALSLLILNSIECSIFTRVLLGSSMLLNIFAQSKNLLYLYQTTFHNFSNYRYNEKYTRSRCSVNALNSVLAFSCITNFLLHSLIPGFNIYAEIILQWPLYGFLYYSFMHCERMCDKKVDYEKRKLKNVVLFSFTYMPAMHCITYPLLSLVVGNEFSHLIIINIGLSLIYDCLNYNVNVERKRESLRSQGGYQ